MPMAIFTQELHCCLSEQLTSKFLPPPIINHSTISQTVLIQLTNQPLPTINQCAIFRPLVNQSATSTTCS